MDEWEFDCFNASDVLGRSISPLLIPPLVRFNYYHLHSIVTPRREMKVVSSFPTRVIVIQLYVLYFKLQIRGRERLQPSATSRK